MENILVTTYIKLFNFPNDSSKKRIRSKQIDRVLELLKI